MADKTKIEWCDATWNVITGCSIESPACTNCYAMRLAGTRLREHPSRKGLTKIVNGNPVWTGEVRFNEQWLMHPIQWKKPRRIFVCAHADLFHPNVPDEWIDRVFAVMALAPQHTFMVLTKRSARMHAYMTKNTQEGWMTGHACGRIGDAIERMRVDNRPVGPTPHGEPGSRWWPLPNVMLGVTAEDQKHADERIPELLATPAANRFVSIEPMLGAIHLRGWETHDWRPAEIGEIVPRLDLVICGGESGHGARPMHPDWPRSIRNQCKAAGVPFMFKQWGAWEVVYDRDKDDPDWRRCPKAQDNNSRYVNIEGGYGFHNDRVVFMRRVGKSRTGRLLDGVEHNGVFEGSS